MAKQLVRFDWAIKRLLKNRADFDILEGFLSVLLNQEIKIEEVLDGESEKEDADSKHNRVDVLVKNQHDERIIIEVQNSKEYDYFHRMAFGISKVISQHIKQGEPYASIKKVISITIAYFDLGQGEDYVYHGKNQFKGIHKSDILTLAEEQVELYRKDEVYEIFPEYWIIKAEKFNNNVEDKLDEWIYFLKNSEVRDDFTAQGLDSAKEKLDEMKMTAEEKKEYKRYLKRIMDIASENHTVKADVQRLLDESEKRGEEKGMEKKEIEFILKLHSNGFSPEEIAKLSGVAVERAREIIKNFA